MKKSLSKIVKEIDLAKASLEKGKEFEKAGKNDKAMKEYESAIKKFLSILKTNDEQSIKELLQQAYLAKGDLLKKSGISSEANKCYSEAANAGSLEAQDRLRGSSNSGSTTLSPPLASNPNRTSPVAPRLSPRPGSSNQSTPTSSQPSSGNSTPIMGNKAVKLAPPEQRGSGSSVSVQPTAPSNSVVGKADSTKVAAVQPPPVPAKKIPAVVSKSSTSQLSPGSTANSASTPSQPVAIFKRNPTPVKLNYKFGQNVKVECTAHLAWLIGKEKKKESEHYQNWLSLATSIISLFAKEPVKQRPEITEVLALTEIDDSDLLTDLLEVFIEPIKKGTLLKPSMLNALADVINHVNPALLDTDDLIQILRVLKDKLEITHDQGSAKKLEQLIRSISRLMTAMVDAGIKGLARKEEHQPLYDCLQKFTSHQNRRITFEAHLALQALARLPNDESNLGSFLRRSFHVIKGAAYIADAVSNMSIVNLLEAYGHFYKAVKIQTTLKNDWYHDLRYAQFLIKWEHFDAFEEFLKDPKINRSEDFYLGILYALKEVVDTHYDEQTQLSALEFINSLFNDKYVVKLEIVRIEILNCLVDTVRQGDPRLAEQARNYITSLSSSSVAKDKSLFDVYLPDLSSITSKTQRSVKSVRNALILATQNPTNSDVIDQLEEMHQLMKVGFEMNPSESVEKKCELLCARVLSDQNIKDELATYIPVRGAYRITDDQTFDMEDKAREFIRSDKRKMLLIGNAGGGKSTFNRYLLTQLWKEYQPGGIIPIFVSLPIVIDPINNLMKEVLSECGFTPKEVDFLKENRELCLILDGYDEVNLTSNLYTSNKLGDWKKISVVVSCRTQYLINFKNYQTFFVPTSGERVQNNLLQEVTVVPFSDAEIEAYISKYIQLHSEVQWKSAEEWVVHIKSIPGLRDLIETPFLLMLTMDVLPELVERYTHLTGAERVKMLQASLYDAFVENWFQREENKLLVRGQLPPDGHDVKEDFLEFGMELASEMYKRKQFQVYYAPTKSIFGNKRDTGKSSPWAMFFSNEPLVAAARKACLLKKVGPQQWAFMHATFVEYFATRKMYLEEMQDDEESTSPQPPKRVDDKVSAAQLGKKGNFSTQPSSSGKKDDYQKGSGSYSSYSSSSKK